MRVLLTGAGGYIGGTIAGRLAARGDTELLLCGRTLPAATSGVALDLLDAGALRRTLADFAPEAVVHAAGRTAGAPSLMLRDNAVATATLGEAIVAEAPAAGLILLGTAAQYGRSPDRRPWRESDPCLPADPYAISKHAGERAVMVRGRASGLKVTALRLFDIVSGAPGGGQAFAGFLGKAAQASAGPPPPRVRMGALGAVRDFVDIEDVGRAVEAVIDRAVWGEVINIASGQGRTVRALIEAAIPLIDGGLILEAPDPAEADDMDWSVGDPSKARALLGFAPSGDLTPVLARAAAWVRSAAKARADAGSGA
jgi:nucleoside-diphosphate-sugar epimerase